MWNTSWKNIKYIRLRNNFLPNLTCRLHEKHKHNLDKFYGDC